MDSIVSYIRVSTARQGTSGLGLDAQRTAVTTYCKQHGCEVAREFTEIESRTNNDRKVLSEAIRFAKRNRTKLVIGKLDRLARNVAFIANLMDSGIEFAACDLPEANRLLLHIMAAVAENEAKAISDRTVAALSAAKARGVALGALNPASRNLTAEAMIKGRKLGAASMKKAAAEAYAEIVPIIVELRAAGNSFAQIATELNRRGEKTRTNKAWSAMQVSRVAKSD